MTSVVRDAVAAAMAGVSDLRASGRQWPPFEVGRATDDVSREGRGGGGDGGCIGPTCVWAEVASL